MDTHMFYELLYKVLTILLYGVNLCLSYEPLLSFEYIKDWNTWPSSLLEYSIQY